MIYNYTILFIIIVGCDVYLHMIFQRVSLRSPLRQITPAGISLYVKPLIEIFRRGDRRE